MVSMKYSAPVSFLVLFFFFSPSAFATSDLFNGQRDNGSPKTGVSLAPEEINQIEQKHSTIGLEQGISTMDTSHWALVAVVSSPVIVFLFLFWNLSLKKQVRERTEDLKQINSALESEIADRMTVESTRHESINNLSKAQSLAHFGSWSWDIEADEIAWSDEAYRIFGVPLGTQLTYQRLMEIIHPKDRDYHNALVAEWLEHKRGKPFEYRIVLSDNSVRYIFAVVELECDEAGGLIRMFGVVQDVSERKIAEAASIKSEEKYRDLVNDSMIGVFNANINGGFTYVNFALAKMYDFNDVEQMLKEGSRSRWAGIQQMEELLSEVKLYGSVRNFEVEIITNNARNIHVLFSAKLSGNTISGMVMDITDKKESEKALAESESKYRNLVDHSLVGVFTTDLSGGFIFANSALAGMYEFDDVEQMLSMGSLPRWTNIEQREKMLRCLKEDGLVSDFEAETVTKNGRRIVVLVTATLHDENITGMVMDVTARKDAEKLLKESEAQLRMIYEHAPVMIDSFDANGQCIMWNKECERVFGWTADEVFSRKNPLALFYPDPEIQQKVIESATSTPNGTFTEWRPLRKDGTEIICLWSNFQLPNGNIVSLGEDVTERKKSEAALREREATLATLLNAPLESIILLSSEKIVLSINEGGARRFGLTPDDLIGRDIFGFMPENVSKKRMDVFNEVFRTGKPVHYEDARKGRALANSVYPVFNVDNKKVVSIAIFSTDISERKESERKLKVSQKKLKDMLIQLTVAEERERRAIAEDLHDHVGQSLALTRLQLETARKSLPKGDRLDAQLDDISQSLLKAIQDTRHLIFELSSPSLNELGLYAAISELAEDLLENKNGIRVKINDHAKGALLDADTRAILFRSVRELLTNIVKHAGAKSVSIWLESKKNNFTLTIQDDGIGFDPVVTLKNVSVKSGFGLFSIQERTTDLGGSMKISSHPGMGCEITLGIPLEATKENLEYESR